MEEQPSKPEEPIETKEPIGEMAPKDSVKAEEEPNPMADWLNAGTSWGTSWLKTAKQKTFQTLELVRKDLTEIKDVIGTEVSGLTTAAKDGLETVSAQVKQQAQLLEKMVSPDEEEREFEDNVQEKTEEQVPKSNSMGFGWMKTFVDSVKNFTVEDTTEGEAEITEVIRPKCLRKTNLSHELLLQIQQNERTYLDEPDDVKTFQGWLRKFSMTEHDGEINVLLTDSPILSEIFSKLVPSVLDSETFWTRYFFKVEIAEIDEEMKHTLKDLQLNTQQKQKLKDDDSSPDSTQKSEPVSGTRSADDWSICDKEEHDIEELTSNGEDTEREDEPLEEAPQTPKPTDVKVEAKQKASAKDRKRKGRK